MKKELIDKTMRDLEARDLIDGLEILSEDLANDSIILENQSDTLASLEEEITQVKESIDSCVDSIQGKEKEIDKMVVKLKELLKQ